ncbi:hypothetical protein [Candidatus Sororendozoicomonas aggregata]|uniref:hypothetical protein n=1 Tax=Candidatus Sororendozoicomonas aggregata TaxID=3073239 RepID=UPI002ED557F3
MAVSIMWGLFQFVAGWLMLYGLKQGDVLFIALGPALYLFGSGFTLLIDANLNDIGHTETGGPTSISRF